MKDAHSLVSVGSVGSSNTNSSRLRSSTVIDPIPDTILASDSVDKEEDLMIAVHRDCEDGTRGRTSMPKANLALPGSSLTLPVISTVQQLYTDEQLSAGQALFEESKAYAFDLGEPQSQIKSGVTEDESIEEYDLRAPKESVTTYVSDFTDDEEYLENKECYEDPLDATGQPSYEATREPTPAANIALEHDVKGKDPKHDLKEKDEPCHELKESAKELGIIASKNKKDLKVVLIPGGIMALTLFCLAYITSPSMKCDPNICRGEATNSWSLLENTKPNMTSVSESDNLSYFEYGKSMWTSTMNAVSEHASPWWNSFCDTGSSALSAVGSKIGLSQETVSTSEPEASVGILGKCYYIVDLAKSYKDAALNSVTHS